MQSKNRKKEKESESQVVEEEKMEVSGGDQGDGEERDVTVYDCEIDSVIRAALETEDQLIDDEDELPVIHEVQSELNSFEKIHNNFTRTMFFFRTVCNVEHIAARDVFNELNFSHYRLLCEMCEKYE